MAEIDIMNQNSEVGNVEDENVEVEMQAESEDIDQIVESGDGESESVQIGDILPIPPILNETEAPRERDENDRADLAAFVEKGKVMFSDGRLARMKADSEFLLEQENAIERACWNKTLFELKNAAEGLQFDISQPQSLEFTGSVLLMKHCVQPDCDFAFIHEPNAPESDLGRCFQCCGWNPEERVPEHGRLVPQYKLVCKKATGNGRFGPHAVHFLIHQSFANVCTTEPTKIGYREMVEILKGEDHEAILHGFLADDVKDSLKVSRVKVDKCTLIYNRPGRPMVIDVHDFTVVV